MLVSSELELRVLELRSGALSFAIVATNHQGSLLILTSHQLLLPAVIAAVDLSAQILSSLGNEPWV